MKQNYLKYFLAFLVILLLLTAIKFFVVNRNTEKTNDIKSNTVIINNKKDILINDSLNRVLIKNDSIIIDLLKKQDKKHGN